MKLRPLADRVVVKPDQSEEATKSGIVIPDIAQEQPHQGEVIAIGPGKYVENHLVPLDVKVGDKIIYSHYGGTEVKPSGVVYLILRENDILAVVKP